VPHPRTEESGSGRLVGEVVGGHELVRVLGVGGQGEVYLGKHQTLGVERAIKVIRADLCSKDNFLQRFTREAQILKRLRHNSIVQLIEFGSLANGQPYLAMEYIEGPSLDHLVEPGPLPIPYAMVVIEQIALALQHAHANNVIHRDLKPANVLVRAGDTRQVKMIDFGFAKLLDADAARLTADGQMIGAPAFMAPELVEGKEVTAAIDVYALAGIAYVLVSQSPPFIHKKRQSQMHAQVTERAPRLSERLPHIPGELDDLFYRCLAKNPADRPPAEEVAKRLGTYVRGMPIETPKVPPAPRIEVVASPWAGPSQIRDISVHVLELPLPRDPEGAGVALATKIMSMIEEIVTYLSTSDPELTPLLRLEARICEQLATVDGDLADVKAMLEETPDAPELVTQRDALVEKKRTLNAQQVPLQRKMVGIVESYRPFASGMIKSLFRQMDRALHELQSLRRQFPATDD
jgi:serine/threonine protein kinase